MPIKKNDPILNPAGDHLVVATARDGRIRGVAVRSTQTVEKLRQVHDLSPAVTHALGRFAIGAQLMAASLKNPTDLMSMTLRCDGPLGGMTMVSGSDSYVRGYALRPQADSVVATAAESAMATSSQNAGHTSLKALVGDGTLTVVKDMGLKEPYSGTVQIYSGEITADLAYYLGLSEQVPSVMASGIKLDETGLVLAGGLLIQLMPGATEDDIDFIERRAAGLPDVSFLLEEGFTPAQLLDLFWGDPALVYLESRPIGFRCNCSRDRMQRNLLTLPASDLKELAADTSGIDLHCHFCNRHYHFTQPEMLELLPR